MKFPSNVTTIFLVEDIWNFALVPMTKMYNKRWYLKYSALVYLRQLHEHAIDMNLCLYWRTYSFKIEWISSCCGGCCWFLYIQYRNDFFTYFFFKVACATAGEAQKWMEAFEQAKSQVWRNNCKLACIAFCYNQSWLWWKIYFCARVWIGVCSSNFLIHKYS